MSVADETDSGTEQRSMFGWQRALALAAGRGEVPVQAASLALLMACNGTGGSGTGCTIDDEKWAAELGCTTRTIWRWRSWLLDAGWFVQTVKATRGANGEGGRRARYRVAIPESSATAAGSGGNRSEPNRLTPAHGEVSDDSANRLTLEHDSSDTTTGGDVRLPTSVGSTTSPGAEGDEPPPCSVGEDSDQEPDDFDDDAFYREFLASPVHVACEAASAMKRPDIIQPGPEWTRFLNVVTRAVRQSSNREVLAAVDRWSHRRDGALKAQDPVAALRWLLQDHERIKARSAAC